MGWTCGNGLASSRDVARFYYDLLGPEKKIVSEESAKIMQNFTTIDKGWAEGLLQYGGGLFPSTAGSKYTHTPPLNDSATYIGHGGHTYGFQSAQGFFPALNVSMSINTN
jgi:hypothetical protein